MKDRTFIVRKVSNLMIPAAVRATMNRLLLAKHNVYIVGGAVRDLLHEVKPKDWDIFTNAPVDALEFMFPEGNVVGSVERQAKIFTLVLPDGIEVNQFRSNGERTEVCDSIMRHCKTCDFTMNALAMDVNGNIYDFSGNSSWFADCKNKIVKFVGDPLKRIAEDPGRITRFYRFMCNESFTTTYKDENVVKVTAYLIKSQPIERFTKEMLKALQMNNPNQFFKYLFLHDVFDHFVPDSVFCTTLWHVDAKYRLHAMLYDMGNIEGEKWARKLGISIKFVEETANIKEALCLLHKAVTDEMVVEAQRLVADIKLLPMARQFFERSCGTVTNPDAYVARSTDVLHPKPIVTGDFLLDQGFKPGKELGVIKAKCYDIQLKLKLSDEYNPSSLLTFIQGARS